MKYCTQRDLSERLWSRVQKGDGCWNWSGAKKDRGYGQFTYKNKNLRPHRVAYELAFGKIAPGMCVCHRCDNRLCCRPDHMFLGTSADNTADMMRKKRHHRGERTGTSKLKWSDVASIREALARGDTQSQVASRHGVNQSTVSNIWTGQTWAQP